MFMIIMIIGFVLCNALGICSLLPDLQHTGSGRSRWEERTDPLARFSGLPGDGPHHFGG